MNRRELWVPREVWLLNGAVDELLAAHDSFDHATFYGTMSDINAAQNRMEAARRRARLAKVRLESAMKQFQALDSLLEDCLDERDDGLGAGEAHHS